MPDPVNVSQHLITRLAVHLGPNVARMAVSDFSRKSLGKKADAVTRTDVPPLLDAMRPMLTVLLGKDHTEILVQELDRDLPA